MKKLLRKLKADWDRPYYTQIFRRERSATKVAGMLPMPTLFKKALGLHGSQRHAEHACYFSPMTLPLTVAEIAQMTENG